MKIFTVTASVVFTTSCQSAAAELRSPDGKVVVKVFTDNNSRLSYKIARDNKTIVETSPIGINIDDTDLGKGVRIGSAEHQTINERYPWRGVKSEAVNHCNTVTLPITHSDSGLTWALQLRAYNDGAALRYIVPGQGKRTVKGEDTGWRLPAGSEIWHQTNIKNYEGIYKKKRPQKLRSGTHIGFPVTVELPGKGYALITEGALFNYSGMTLRATGSTLLKGVFEDDRRGWELEGTIISPWRITVTTADLNGLVNCDIVHNVCPPPDEKLFPQGMHTDWIKPGRALWHWWSIDEPEYAVHKDWVAKAGEFGFEYYLVDEGWSRWQSPGGQIWDLVRELVNFGRQHNVGIWLWKASSQRRGIPGILDSKDRRQFFQRCSEAGVVGVKIDFMDSESKEMVAFYENALRDAAGFKLMVNFHGANKPTGEPRTWPNEMTREAIMGLEHNKWSALGPQYYASLPFTRFPAGDGDFTPCTFNPNFLKGTTFALQLATAVVYTSSVLHWADRPELYLQSEAYELIKKIPSVWDETRVLAGSRIGELAAFARRKNNEWFVGIINGDKKRRYNLNLSFLDKGSYHALLVRDDMDDPPAMKLEGSMVGRDKTLNIEMRSGGGFVACFAREKTAIK